MNKYEQIISSCGFSEEMKNYLLDIDILETTVIDIILGAPIPLTKKRELIDKMHTPDSKKVSEISSCLVEIDEALEALELKDRYIFTLSKCWYDKKIMDETKSSAKTFKTFQAVLDYINKTIEEDAEHSKDGEETNCWIEVKKCDSFYMIPYYSYTLFSNEIYYFKRFNYTGSVSFSACFLDLNLPIPFKPGDIVTLNCTPFRPVKHAVLLEVNERNRFGISTTILYCRKSEINGEKILDKFNLRYGHGWDYDMLELSSIYRLSKFEGQLSDEECWMKDVRRYVLKDEGNDSKLCDFIHNKAYQNETELYEFLEKNM